MKIKETESECYKKSYHGLLAPNGAQLALGWYRTVLSSECVNCGPKMLPQEFVDKTVIFDQGSKLNPDTIFLNIPQEHFRPIK